MSTFTSAAGAVPLLSDNKTNDDNDSNNDNNNNNNNTKTWSQVARESYDAAYTSWVPWVEDLYLRYCTRHNKASYATEDALSKTKVTGIQQVDTLQDGVHGLVAGQVGQGGLLQPVGDALSHHGVNRAERSGRDADGTYMGSAANSVPGGQALSQGAEAVGSSVQSGASSIGGGLQNGAKSVGNGLGGLFGKT